MTTVVKNGINDAVCVSVHINAMNRFVPFPNMETYSCRLSSLNSIRQRVEVKKNSEFKQALHQLEIYIESHGGVDFV